MAYHFSAADHGFLRTTADRFIDWSTTMALIAGWAKFDAYTDSSCQLFYHGRSSSGATNVRNITARVTSAQAVLGVTYDGGFPSVTHGTSAPATGTWAHYAAFTDLHDGTSGTIAVWLNGVKASTTDTLATFSGSAGTERTCIAVDPFGTNDSTMRIARAGLWTPTTEAQADSIVSELQTLAPESVTTLAPLDSWSLISDLLSDSSGINLEVSGTAGAFDSEDPLSGGGGGGRANLSETVIIL